MYCRCICVQIKAFKMCIFASLTPTLRNIYAINYKKKTNESKIYYAMLFLKSWTKVTCSLISSGVKR